MTQVKETKKAQPTNTYRTDPEGSWGQMTPFRNVLGKPKSHFSFCVPSIKPKWDAVVKPMIEAEDHKQSAYLPVNLKIILPVTIKVFKAHPPIDSVFSVTGIEVFHMSLYQSLG